MCFGHIMFRAINMLQMIKGDYRFKTCQCEGCLKQFIVDNHMNKSIGKGRHEWEKACVERGL